jgi:hypothetical protein
MDKIEFITAVGTTCCGYLFTWKDFSFGLTRDSDGSGKNWDVIELATGCSVIGKGLPTQKKAKETALSVLEEKGITVVRKKIRQVLLERVNTPVKGKIKIAHCTTPENRLKTVCGRVKDAYTLPVEYFRKAKKPCQRCRKLVRKKTAG